MEHIKSNDITKINLIRKFITELNENEAVNDIINECTQYAKNVISPYYKLHVVIQILILICLVFIIYKIRKI